MPQSLPQRLVLLFVVLLTVGATGYMTLSVLTRQQREAPQTLWAAPAFEMLDQDGQPFTRADLNGRVWVASFFFTSCPAVCPAMNSQLADLRKRMDQRGKLYDDVTLVSFSIDPQTDRPAVLKDVAKSYHERWGVDLSRWVFLTEPDGDREKVWRLIGGADGFRVSTPYIPDQPTGNPIEHAPRFLLIDRDGMVRNTYDSRVAEEMETLLLDAAAVARE